MMSEKQMFGNKTRLGILILGYDNKPVPWVAGLYGWLLIVQPELLEERKMILEL